MGKPVTYLTDYAKHASVTYFTSGGNVSATQSCICWRRTFVVDAQNVGFAVLGGAAGGTGYRFIVDGQFISFTKTTVVSGGRQYIVLPFASKAARTITIEGELGATAITGIFVAPGDTVAAPSDFQFKAMWEGDSFGTSTGSTSAGDGIVPVLADYFGLEIWPAAVGGSGFINTQLDTRYNVPQRWAADLALFRSQEARDPDLVFFAATLNDVLLSGIEAAVLAQLRQTRQDCPAAVIVIYTAWDTAAPSAPIAEWVSAKAAVSSAANSVPGCVFVDLEGVAFSKSDATHPDDAGVLDDLGPSLNTLTRAALAGF